MAVPAKRAAAPSKQTRKPPTPPPPARPVRSSGLAGEPPMRRLGDLVVDWTIYPKAEQGVQKVDSEMLAQVKESYRAGVPLKVFVITEDNVIVDGLTSYFAAMSLKDLYGPDAVVAVEVRHLHSHWERARVAIELNSLRGKDLTRFQFLRCIQIAEDDRVSMEELAAVLHVRTAWLLEHRRTRVGRTVNNRRVNTKAAIKHLVEERHRFTTAEAAANTHLSGSPLLFHVNQLITFFENPPFIQESEALQERCEVLLGLITDHFGFE